MRRSVALFVASVLMFTAVNVSAQSKKLDGLVVGLETGQFLGAVGLYQLNENLQIGSGLGLQVGDNTLVFISPQVRYLAPLGIADVHIVGEAQLRLLLGDQDDTALLVRASLQKWVTDNVAVYGGVSVLSLELDPSVIGIGLLTPHVGLQVRL